MFTSRLFLALAASTLVAACGKDGATLGEFDVDQSIPEFQVKGSAVAAELPNEFSPIPLNVKTEEGYKNEDFQNLSMV